MTDVERQRIRRHRARGLDTPPEGIVVRGVEYEVSNRDSDQTGPIRVIITLLDHEQVSAAELAATYHQRWEFESSLAEIETRQRGSYRPLRSQSPAMVRQEIWGLLTTHYAIRNSCTTPPRQLRTPARYGCRSSVPCALSGDRSPDRRVSP